MRENGDFVKACEVFWGEWVDFETCNIEDPTTPETILIDKDIINKLPNECKLMANMILNLPEEMFLVNGKLKRTFFRKFVKSKTGWSMEKVDQTHRVLGYYLLRSQKF